MCWKLLRGNEYQDLLELATETLVNMKAETKKQQLHQ